MLTDDGGKSRSRFSRWERRIFPGWLFEPGNEEYRRITLFAYPTVFVAVLILVMVGGLNLIHQETVKGWVTLLFAAVLAALVKWHRRSHVRHDLISTIGVAAFGIFCLYLFFFAAIPRPVFLWSYSFPLAALFFLGPRKGALAVTLFLVPAVLLLAFDPPLAFLTSYSRGFTICFIPSFLVVFGLSYLYERNREKNQQRMERQVSERTAELARSEEKYRSILENIDEMCFEVDLKGNIVFFNEATCRLSGYSESEALGMNYRKYTSPETAKSLEASFNRIYRTGEKGSLRDFEMIRKDKSLRDLEISFNLMRNPAGEAVGFRSIARDVTERKRAEKALQESESRYRFLAEHMTEAVWLMDTALKVTYGSPSLVKMRGYTLEEIGQLPLDRHLTPESLELALTIFAEETDKVVADSAYLPVRTVELEFYRKDGTTFWAECTFRLIRGKNGKPEAILGEGRDITGRKEIEGKLHESERLFRSIVETSYAGIYTSDRDFRFSYVNDKLCEISGYSREELLGTDFRRLIAAESLPLIEDRYVRRRRGEDVPSSYEFTGVGKDGQKRFFETSAVAVPDISGEVTSIGQILDISGRKLAQQALQQSEELFRLVAENARDTIWMMDMNLKYTYMSPYVEQIVGYTPEEFMAMPLEESMTEASFKACMEALAEEMEIEKRDGRDLLRSRTLEIEQIGRQGRRVWAEIKVTFIRNAAGEATGILGITRDISERKRTEEALKKSEKYFRAITENAADILFIVDAEGKITYCSPSVARILGYRPEALVGTQALSMIIPEDRPRAIEDFARASLTTGIEVPNSFRVRHRNGAVITLEGIGKNLYHDPVIAGFVMNVRDVTGRKRMEEELRRLSIAVEQAVEDIVITDPEGVIQYVNPAFEKITGYSRAEAIGGNPRLLRSGVHDRAFYEDLWNTVKDGKIWTGRITNRRKDGRLFQEDAIISPMSNSTGELMGYVALKRDVTESVRLENQLRQAQKMEAIGTLAGGIAHDFNNMLGAMMGYVELTKYKTEDATILAYLDQVLLACNRARDLVTQILTFSRQREKEKRPAAVAPIVKEAMKLLRSSIPATVEIRQSYAAGNDTVLADPTQLHQVLMNLCTNAVHAIGEREGILTVSLGRCAIEAGSPAYDPELKAGSYLQLTVSDNGKGIDPAVRDKIFDPFFTTKRPGEGTGLGLSVVYGIVKDHGGVISVESEPGRGAAFTITLPLIEIGHPHEGEETAIIPQGSGSILLVDDEEPIAYLGQKMLAALGYDVSVQLSSSEALSEFLAHPERYDLVITDMTMPHMTGAVLAGEMLKIRPGLPIIMTTGFSDRIDEEEAKRIGIREFIMKPVPLPVIAPAVKKIMDEK